VRSILEWTVRGSTPRRGPQPGAGQPGTPTMPDKETDRERGEKRGLVSTDDVDAGDADAANDDAED